LAVVTWVLDDQASGHEKNYSGKLFIIIYVFFSCSRTMP